MEIDEWLHMKAFAAFFNVVLFFCRHAILYTYQNIHKCHAMCKEGKVFLINPQLPQDTASCIKLRVFSSLSLILGNSIIVFCIL